MDTTFLTILRDDLKACGSIKAAAEALGYPYQTLANKLSGYCRMSGDDIVRIQQYILERKSDKPTDELSETITPAP